MTTPTETIAGKLALFAKEKDPGRLDEAIDLMADPLAAAKARKAEWLRARRHALAGWLSLLAVVDRELDPNFSSDEPLVLKVPPPIGPPDPEAQASYEKAQEAQKQKALRFRLQTHLQRIDQQASDRTSRFIANQYAAIAEDRKEFDELLDKSAIADARKDRLRAAYPVR